MSCIFGTRSTSPGRGGYDYINELTQFQMVPHLGTRDISIVYPDSDDAILFCADLIANVSIDTPGRRGDTTFPSYVVPRNGSLRLTLTGLLPGLSRWHAVVNGETATLITAVLPPVSIKVSVAKILKDITREMNFADEAIIGMLREVKAFFLDSVNITLTWDSEFQYLTFPEHDFGPVIMMDKFGDVVQGKVKPTSADKVLIYGWDIDDSRDGVVAFGRAQLGGRFAWMDANTPWQTTAHELCHSLGLDHDNGDRPNLMNNTKPGEALLMHQIIAASAGAAAFDALTA